MLNFIRCIVISGIVLCLTHDSFFAEEQIDADIQVAEETVVTEGEAATQVISEVEEVVADSETTTNEIAASETVTKTEEKKEEAEAIEQKATKEMISEKKEGASSDVTIKEKKEDKVAEQAISTDQKWYNAIELQPLIDYYEKLLQTIEAFKQRINPAMHKSALVFNLNAGSAYKEGEETVKFAALQDFISFTYYQKISGSMSKLNLVNHERFVKEVIPEVGDTKFPTGFVSVDKYQAQRLLIYEGYHQNNSFVQGAIIKKIDSMLNAIIATIKTETYKLVVKDYLNAYRSAKKVLKVSQLLDKSINETKSIQEWLATITKIYNEKKGAPLIVSALEASCSMPRGSLMLRLRRARHRLYHYLINKVPELSDNHKKNLALMYQCENRVDIVYHVE